MYLGVSFKVHEDKCLVNCGDLPPDCWNIYFIIMAFRFSEDKEGFFEVMSDGFLAREVMLFT